MLTNGTTYQTANRLAGLSALKLCYGKNISYTELNFINTFFFMKILYDHLKRMLLLYFFQAA